MLALLETWQRGDISIVRDGGDFAGSLRAIKAKALIMPCKTDLYFCVRDSCVPSARHCHWPLTLGFIWVLSRGWPSAPARRRITVVGKLPSLAMIAFDATLSRRMSPRLFMSLGFGGTSLKTASMKSRSSGTPSSLSLTACGAMLVCPSHGFVKDALMWTLWTSLSSWRRRQRCGCRVHNYEDSRISGLA